MGKNPEGNKVLPPSWANGYAKEYDSLLWIDQTIRSLERVSSSERKERLLSELTDLKSGQENSLYHLDYFSLHAEFERTSAELESSRLNRDALESRVRKLEYVEDILQHIVGEDGDLDQLQDGISYLRYVIVSRKRRDILVFLVGFLTFLIILLLVT